MHLFTDYVEPLTLWLYANPSWALLITFVISLTESLAIIGSIIPGSVTMTAIGILAGSGVMDIGLTFAAAAGGAVAGDSISYAIGYTFSEHLADMWPFCRYPQWLNYGKTYFTRHGSKSVIIGRFFGPLRSIIPVIAGILHMNQWHFLLANIISAIGWSILYVTPGVLIGAASSELSPESATRLFILILAILASAWVSTLSMKWLFRRGDYLLHIVLHKIWSWSRRHPQLSHLLKALTPQHQKKNYYPTSVLLLLFIYCFLASLIITLFVLQDSWISIINNPILLFLQSIRTPIFDTFFIVMSLAISPLSLATLCFAVIVYALAARDWRLLIYWISLIATCSITTWALTSIVNIPKPEGLLTYKFTPVYPAINLTLATALFGFLISYVKTYYRSIAVLILKFVLISILMLAGLACVYLGDNWATSSIAAYFIGTTLFLVHWILFRRHLVHECSPLKSQLIVVFICLLMVLTTSLSYFLYFKKYVRDHYPNIQQFVLTNKAWWHQNQPLLPVYTTNRIGHRVGLFNIQYLGLLNEFEQALTTYGWKKQSDSFFHSLLMRAGGKKSTEGLPLMQQLYLNKQPNLIMTYESPLNKNIYILRLWRSNYHLLHYKQPIWLGSVIAIQKKSHDKAQQQKQDPFIHLIPALAGYQLKNMSLSNTPTEQLPTKTLPYLLRIKSPPINNNKTDSK